MDAALDTLLHLSRTTTRLVREVDSSLGSTHEGGDRGRHFDALIRDDVLVPG